MKQLLTGALAASTLAVATFAQAAPAQALNLSSTFFFQNIAGGDTAGDDFANDFSVQINEQSSTQVLFRFLNDAPLGATRFISQVAFDYDGNLLSNAVLNSGNLGTVAFSPDNNPNLPQGGELNPVFDAVFGANRDTGGRNCRANACGIQFGESLGIQFNGTYASVINAINNGDLRLGIHVQSLPNGGSDSYAVANPATPIPTPALVPAALGMGAALLRKKKQEEAAQKV